MAAGMNDHITKPIEPEELHSCLARWVKPISGCPQDGDPLQNKENMLKEEQCSDFPRSIPGIDLETGLTRVAGNKTLYLKLLGDFQKQNEHFSEHVREALKDDDLETVNRLVHTLKGLAGTLGALELQKKALELESTIREGRGNVQNKLESTWNTLQAVMDGIRELLPERQDVTIYSPSDDLLDLEDIAPKVKKLREFLEIRDMNAEKIFVEIEGALFSHYPDQTVKLSDALGELNFKGALQEVLAIQELLEM